MIKGERWHLIWPFSLLFYIYQLLVSGVCDRFNLVASLTQVCEQNLVLQCLLCNHLFATYQSKHEVSRWVKSTTSADQQTHPMSSGPTLFPCILANMYSGSGPAYHFHRMGVGDSLQCRWHVCKHGAQLNICVLVLPVQPETYEFRQAWLSQQRWRVSRREGRFALAIQHSTFATKVYQQIYLRFFQSCTSTHHVLKVVQRKIHLVEVNFTQPTISGFTFIQHTYNCLSNKVQAILRSCKPHCIFASSDFHTGSQSAKSSWLFWDLESRLDNILAAAVSWCVLISSHGIWTHAISNSLDMEFKLFDLHSHPKVVGAA